MRANYERRFIEWSLLKRKVPENKFLLHIIMSIAKLANKRLNRNDRIVESVMLKYRRINKPEVEKNKDGTQKYRGDGTASLSEMIE